MKIHTAPARARKKSENVSRREQLRRLRKIVQEVNIKIADIPENDKKKFFRDIVKENPDILETYGQYPLDEEDVTEMIRDANLVDAQVLKILSIIRRKWGKHKVTPNMRKLLQEKKQLVAHLFDVEYLDKDDPVHFVDKDGQPVSR